MSAPVGGDLSATSPSALLGDPSAASPGSISVGSRGGRRGRLHGLLGRDLSGRTPKAPLSPAQRDKVHGAQQVERREAQPAPTPATRQAPPADRPRTAAGAPADRPREVPKTGEAEAERDAWRRVIGKDPARFHGGISAKAQDQMNKLLRNKARIATRRGNETLEDLFKTMRREDDQAEWKRKHPGKDDDTGASPSGGSKPPPPPPTDGPAPSPPPAAKARRAKNWQGIDQTLNAMRGEPDIEAENEMPPTKAQRIIVPKDRDTQALRDQIFNKIMGAANAPRQAPPVVQRVVIPKKEDDE